MGMSKAKDAVCEEIERLGNVKMSVAEREVLAKAPIDVLHWVRNFADRVFERGYTQGRARGMRKDGPLPEVRRRRDQARQNVALMIDDKDKRIAELTHQRDVIAREIAEAAVRLGIVVDGVPLTGPQVILLVRDVAEAARRGMALSKSVEALAEAGEGYASARQLWRALEGE